MNNLKLFRELSGIDRLIIARFLNVNIYTYMGYENERLVLPKSIERMIAKMYNIEVDDIYRISDLLSQDTVANLKSISLLEKDKQIELLFFNLTGKKSGRLTYREISQIKNMYK